ncbi:MAG: GNAT family N-acetyltransferase, partial [Anaerolineales bacterium]|nr:GNAT family N-acetyltransferase [Anaerolineales bacterium]
IEGQRCYLIANVAVAPQFRRRGIARALTLRAINHAQRKGAQKVWLHVRAENTPAVNLYLSIGFLEKKRRSSWHVGEEHLGVTAPCSDTALADVRITTTKKNYWLQQQAWLKEIYPPEIIWNMPFNINAFNPTLRGSFYRIMTATSIKQWAAVRKNQLLGVLTWQPHQNQTDNLWLATSPENEDTAILALLPHIRRHLPRRNQLTLDYPAGRGTDALKKAGYSLHQTLIWMALKIDK